MRFILLTVDQLKVMFSFLSSNSEAFGIANSKCGSESTQLISRSCTMAFFSISGLLCTWQLEKATIKWWSSLLTKKLMLISPITMG